MIEVRVCSRLGHEKRCPVYTKEQCKFDSVTIFKESYLERDRQWCVYSVPGSTNDTNKYRVHEKEGVVRESIYIY